MATLVALVLQLIPILGPECVTFDPDAQRAVQVISGATCLALVGVWPAALLRLDRGRLRTPMLLLAGVVLVYAAGGLAGYIAVDALGTPGDHAMCM